MESAVRDHILHAASHVVKFIPRMRLARRAAEWAAVTVASVPLGLFYSIVLARTLGAGARGQYAVFTTAVGIVSGVLALGIGIVARAEIAAQPEKARGIHSNLVWFVALLTGTLLAVAWLLPASIRSGHPFDRAVPLVICAAAAIYAGYGTLVLQGLGHFRWVNALRLGRSALDIVCLAVLVVSLRLGLGGAIWSWTTAGVIASLVMLYLIVRVTGSPVRANFSTLLGSFRHGWKILLAGQAIALQGSIVILMLNKSSTSAEVGVFAIALGLSAQVASLCATLAVVASDRIAGPHRMVSEDLVKRLARILLALSIPIMIGAAVLSGPVVTLLYGQEYAPAARLFTILLAGTLLSQITEVHAQYLIGQHWKSLDTMLLNIGNLVVGGLLAITLIPWLGATGAAITLSAGYILNAVMYHVWVRRTMGCARHELLIIKRSDVRSVLSAVNLVPREAGT